MYSREVDGQVLEFGVSGKLIRNALVMYDRQTNSLWSQILGVAVEGPMQGSELRFFASKLTTWQAWREQHPDTLALIKGYPGAHDPYRSYYFSSQAGVIGETVRDGRLDTKELVLGVSIGEEAAAYPLPFLELNPLHQDSISGIPLLIIFDPDAATAAVFSRSLGDQVLSFGSSGDLLRDDGSGSLWDPRLGLALEGPFAGQSLEPIRGTILFWFAWKDFYPHTRIGGQQP